MKSEQVVSRLLSVVGEDVLPLTSKAVQHGNKIFGAAILNKSNLDLVVAETNEEIKNPMLHGEVSCLNRFWSLPHGTRPEPRQCLFLATHEPCSLCLSAITWSGFDNFYYLFSYEDSRDEFAIPHDLNILKEVFKCEQGSYAPVNAYWQSHHIMELIRQQPEHDRQRLLDYVDDLRHRYNELSNLYQDAKDQHCIPLA